MNKKILIIITTLLISVGLFSVTKAMTIQEILAQIAKLQNQIYQLQTQLSQIQIGTGTDTNTSTGTDTKIPTGTWCYNFNINLAQGNIGTTVESLQTALEKESFLIDIIEKNNKSFGPSTLSAVMAFQNKYKSDILTPLGLTNGTGFVGLNTRLKLNKLYGCVIIPAPVICGNGIIETGEQCDDKNIANGDGCSSTCKIEVAIPLCGDKICNSGENCTSCQADCGACNIPPAPILSPIGGEMWRQGTSQVIRWTPNEKAVNSIMINLYREGLFQKTLAGPMQDIGQWTWNIPASQLSGSSYSIRVSRLSYPKDFIADSKYFSIIGNPSVTLLSPNGGEIWKTGETRDITWKSSGIEKLYIGVRCVEGAVVPMFTSPNIARGVSASLGKFSWKVDASSITMCDKYKVAVGSTIQTGKGEAITGIFDESNNSFIITNSSSTCIPNGCNGNCPAGCSLGQDPDCGCISGNACCGSGCSNSTDTDCIAVTLISPNGGESWMVEKNYEIKWNATGYPSNSTVQIGLRDTRYDPSLGAGEATIVNTTNSGSYSWTIPSQIGYMNLGAGNVYKIVIYIDKGGSGKYDSSDNSFSINSTAASCSRKSPVVTVNPASQSGNPGTTLTYTINVTNADTSSCSSSNIVLQYTVYCPAGWTCTLGPAMFNSLNPGATLSTTLKITPPVGAQPGSYTLALVGTNLQSGLTGSETNIEYVVSTPAPGGGVGSNFLNDIDNLLASISNFFRILQEAIKK